MCFSTVDVCGDGNGAGSSAVAAATTGGCGRGAQVHGGGTRHAGPWELRGEPSARFEGFRASSIQGCHLALQVSMPLTAQQCPVFPVSEIESYHILLGIRFFQTQEGLVNMNIPLGISSVLGFLLLSYNVLCLFYSLRFQALKYDLLLRPIFYFWLDRMYDTES